MNTDPEIRESGAGDLAALETLYPDAFPHEDLLPVVRQLLAAPQGVLSLVAVEGHTVVGHVAFTICGVDRTRDVVALLAPLAVASAHQRKGLGKMLVRNGLDQLQNASVERVFVLGDPAYYGRFGFEAEQNVLPPYRLPAAWEGAWQSLSFAAANNQGGQIQVPAMWRDKALWSP